MLASTIDKPPSDSRAAYRNRAQALRHRSQGGPGFFQPPARSADNPSTTPRRARAASLFAEMIARLEGLPLPTSIEERDEEELPEREGL